MGSDKRAYLFDFMASNFLSILYFYSIKKARINATGIFKITKPKFA